MRAVSLVSVLTIGTVNADTASGTGFVSYNWMNAVVNKTPVDESVACPSIDTDIYGAGFRVARQKNFYASLAGTGSRWFPDTAQWASVGVGPIKNSFGIFFTDIDKLEELSEVKEKKLPNSFEELQSWKVSDSAYWESQGGVSLYLGTGVSPVSVGTFIVATGGWVNYLQKTGPNKVYVEMSKKKIRSVSFGVGSFVPNINLEKAFEDSKGFAFEFTLDNQENIQAFERFMAGDATKAQDLARFQDSGVAKISDLSDSRNGFSRSFVLATPYLPIFSFRSSSERAYDQTEENSVWDEKVLKDTGIYIKQRNLFLAGAKIKEVRSFVGGRVVSEVPGLEGAPNKTEKLFGNFKYAYQSNWGQELRLRHYLNKVKALTGLTEETCARVPAFKDSLGFNQVVLEVNWSDEFVKEIAGLGASKGNFLKTLKEDAQNIQNNLDKADKNLCSYVTNDGYKDDCSTSTSSLVEKIFKNLESYSFNMNRSFKTDKKEFAKNLVKYGEEIWKSPSVFKAFYERGKICGQELKFEVSGQRLTRHLVTQKFANTAECSNF